MQSRPGLGIALALAAAAGYGFLPVLARLGFENGVAAWETGWIRATAIIVVFTAVASIRRIPLAVPDGAWPGMLALSLVTGLVSLSYLGSVEFIPVGLAAIIFYTYPILVVLASPILEGRPLGVYRLSVAALAFAGLSVAIGFDFGGFDIRGILFAMLAAVTAAAQLFAARALSARMPALAFGLVSHLIIWPFLLLAALWWSGGAFATFSPGTVSILGYLAVGGVAALYVVTFFAHMKCLNFAPASTVAPFFNLEPVTTMLLAAAVLGERLTAYQYLGGAMVLLALLLAGLEAQARRAWPPRRGVTGGT